MKAESPLGFLAVLTCQGSHLRVLYVYAHMCMCSKGRVEAQNYKTNFSDPLCFSDFLCLIFVGENNRAYAASNNMNGKKSLLRLF